MKFKLISTNKIIFLLSLMLCAVSCGDDPYLYDRSGFDSSARPIVAPNPRAPNPVSPDYYSQQNQQQMAPQYYAPQPQYYPPQSVPAYIPNPAYQPYAQPAPYPQYPAGSRYYSNPYSMPPSSRYQRYDEDQYYVPPSYYNNVEPQNRTNGLSVNDLTY